MIPVLEFKVELLSNHRWRVTDTEGRSLMAEKALDVGYAVRNLLDLRVVEQRREREAQITAENLRRLAAEAETALALPLRANSASGTSGTSGTSGRREGEVP